jgi:DNA-binding CsgD family transcriptional regulator
MDSSQFSEREKDVIKLLFQGKSNKQIAFDLGISNRTVEFHLSNIYSKLGVTSRTESFLKLSENYLWESTGNPAGNIQVESTVEQVGDSSENGIKPISKRIPMKNLYYIIGGGLITALIVFMAVTNLPAQSLDPAPTLPIEQTHTISVIDPPATLSLPTQTPTVTLQPVIIDNSSLPSAMEFMKSVTNCKMLMDKRFLVMAMWYG